MKELAAIAANYPTPLGGGNMGHVGLVIDSETYKKLSGGHEFIKPTYPGPKKSLQTKTDFEQDLRIFDTCKGVEQGLKDKIIEAVEESYLIELEEDVIGYMNVTVRQMIEHLQERSGGLDHKDVSAIAAERDAEWDVTETPAVYFNKVEKAIKQLERFNIQTDLTLCMNRAIEAFDNSGLCDAAVREWNNKDKAEKTWSNAKKFINTEYAKANKNNLTARNTGYGAANALQVSIEDMEEEINNIADRQQEGMESVVKAVKELALAIAEIKKQPAPTQTTPSAEGKKKKKGRKTYQERQDERKKMFDKAPVCKHCNVKHPWVKEEKCWELEENADDRPSGWKSRKTST